MRGINRIVSASVVVAALAVLAWGGPVGAQSRQPVAVVARPAVPTNERPLIEISDQWLQDGVVIAGRVVAAEAGWVDIHAESATPGYPGEVIGHAPVAAGETTYVRIPLDAARTTPALYALLHQDEGVEGAFEYPGPDLPVLVEGHTLVTPFRLLGNLSRQAGQSPGPTATPGAAIPRAAQGTGVAPQFVSPLPTPTVMLRQSAAPSTLGPLPEATPELLPRAGSDFPIAAAAVAGVLILLAGGVLWVQARRRGV